MVNSFEKRMLRGHVTVEEMKANALMLQKQRQCSLNLPDDDDLVSFFFFLNLYFFQLDLPSRS